MFNKFAKVIRWSVLLGMLYTLYVVTMKENIEFTNQKDEKVLVKVGDSASKSKDRLLAYRRLVELHPQNSDYQNGLKNIVKQQANALLDAHEKLLLPIPIGNYRYIRKIEFAKDSSGKYLLIFNLTEIFQKQDKNTQNTLKNMFIVSHHGMYKHFGFDKDMKLLLVPIFDSKDEVEIIDLERVYKDADVGAPSRIEDGSNK